MVVIRQDTLIAIVLWRSKKFGIGGRSSFGQVAEYGRQLLSFCNRHCVDAVVMSHSLSTAIGSSSKFFKRVELNGVPYVQCASGVSESDLEKLFFFLPNAVLDYVMTVPKKK